MIAPKALIAGAARIGTGRRADRPARGAVGHLSGAGHADCSPPCTGELGRSTRRPACSPSPAEHLRGSETASITIIERL